MLGIILVHDPQKERRGYPYEDTHDWSIHNERLVRRGEFCLSLVFVDQWVDLLSRMNAGRWRRPYLYPEPFIAWMARSHPFLQMEGFVRKLAECISTLTAADYTTLFCRIKCNS